jgi:hypothetical protein
MAKQLGVTPSELRRTSRHLNDHSSMMKDVQSSLRENLRSEGTPWVGGKAGERFANGDTGFLAQLRWVDDSVLAKTGLLDVYSSLLKGIADRLQQQDES